MTVGLCAALVGITGCDSSSSSGGGDSTATGGLTGTWTINRAVVTAPQVGDNSLLLELAGADVSGDTLTANSSFLRLFGIAVTLIIDGDGTWALQVTVPSIPGFVSSGTYTAEGTYTTAGDRMTLTFTTVPGAAGDLVSVGDTFTIGYSQTGNTLDLSASSADIGQPGIAIAFNFTR